LEIGVFKPKEFSDSGSGRTLLKTTEGHLDEPHERSLAKLLSFSKLRTESDRTNQDVFKGEVYVVSVRLFGVCQRHQ